MDVVLVHGLGRTPASLFGLAAAVRRAGHRAHFIGYAPTVEPLSRIVRRVADRLTTVGRGSRPVGLVGHSLGGLLLRLASAELPALRVRHMVLLGTPNRPPRLAARAWNWAAFRWLAGECGAWLARPDGVTALPTPKYPYTLVAGTAGPRGRFTPFGGDSNDGVVAVGEVPIRDDDEPVCLPVLHTVMMNDPRVQWVVVDALRRLD